MFFALHKLPRQPTNGRHHCRPQRRDAGCRERRDSSRNAGFWALALGSIGVVYGDIGTSPLYAFRESVLAATGAGSAAERAGRARHPVADHLGADPRRHRQIRRCILLRADNKGEGGTLALMALASRALGRTGGAIILLGIISGALFYGDAIITPALSVLSAVEGLKVVDAGLRALRRAADGA